MARHNQVGKWGERLALEHLVRQGYAIRETNWKLTHFEIDIIAMHNNRLVFVEVKTRTSHEDNPLAAIDLRKMRKMVSAANAYVRHQNLPHEVQYDIITINGTPDNYKIRHIPDAFLSPLRAYR